MNWNHDSPRAMTCAQDTTILDLPVVTPEESSQRSSDHEQFVAEEILATEIIADDNSPVIEGNETPMESMNRSDKRIDDPKPEGHDLLNPIITPIVGAAFVIPLILLILELFSAFPANPYALLIGLPLVAAILFALAMNMRKKYTVLKSIGDKRDHLRTSAHFHRFQILLYIYFSAAVMLSLGFALGLTTSGILGWVGVIFTGGGIAVGLGVAAVLLVLFAMYWVLWRKDPTGIKPPRNPHPPKDR